MDCSKYCEIAEDVMKKVSERYGIKGSCHFAPDILYRDYPWLRRKSTPISFMGRAIKKLDALYISHVIVVVEDGSQYCVIDATGLQYKAPVCYPLEEIRNYYLIGKIIKYREGIFYGLDKTNLEIQERVISRLREIYPKVIIED